jgi:hypothetical protein
MALYPSLEDMKIDQILQVCMHEKIKKVLLQYLDNVKVWWKFALFLPSSLPP